MAQMIDLDFDPDEKTLRQFGFIALFGFSAIAALAWFELFIFAAGWLGEAREVCLAFRCPGVVTVVAVAL